jgi:hypothetical protein
MAGVEKVEAERDALKATIERAREMHRRSCLVATNPYPEGTLDGVICHMCATLNAPEAPEKGTESHGDARTPQTQDASEGHEANEAQEASQ